MFVHLSLGLWLGNWWFSGAVIIGCVSNVVGYAARTSLWKDPFSFIGVLLQISGFVFCVLFVKEEMEKELYDQQG